MRTSVFLRMEIIVLGLFSIGLVLTVIYNIIKEKKISFFFIGIIGFLLIGGCPVWGLYINLNKYLTKPKPTNVMETCIGEKTYLVYQDTIHLCYPSNKNSTCFTSFMSLDCEVYKTDTCIICRRSFLDHDTHREHRYYETVSYMNESMNYCYKPKSDNYVIMARIGSINEIDTSITFWNNTKRIDVLQQKTNCSHVFCNFAFQEINTRIKNYYHE